MFWKMCGRVVKGAMPSQEAPSPPIWVKPRVCRSIQVAMKWQPMPATAMLPSGTLVELLCGQPGQNQGSRASPGATCLAAWARASSSPSRASSSGSPVRSTRRRAIASATALLSKRAMGGKERLPLLVLLADHAGPLGCRVEQLLDLPLDQRALLLDHHDEVEPLDRTLQHLRLERPGHGRLVDAQAERPGTRIVDPEIVERRDHVHPGLAGRDDAEPGAFAAQDDAVETVGTGEGFRGLELLRVQQPLDLERHRRPGHLGGDPDVEPARGRRVVLRHPHDHAVGIDVDRGRALDRVVNAFQRHPRAREAGHGDAEKAVLQNLLHARRVQDRHHRIDHGVLALVRRGARFADVIVAQEKQHAALRVGAEEVAVPDGIARAIDAGSLAVPDGEDAVVLGSTLQTYLLGALACRRRQILVHPRLVDDVMLGEQRLGPLELLVVAAQRRASIAGDVARRVPPGCEVEAALHHRQPHQRLDAGHEDRPALQRVLVVEVDLAEQCQGRIVSLLRTSCLVVT